MTLYKFNFCDSMIYDSKSHKSRPLHEFVEVVDAVRYVEKRGLANEVMHGDQITKVFFDFDKVIEKEDWNQVDAENKNNVYAIVNHLFCGKITESDIAIAERCRVLNDGTFKISLRYYLPKFVAKYKNIPNWLRICGVSQFDEAPYKQKEQLLACVHNYKKKGDTKPLTPITNHKTEDFIVQVVPEDAFEIPLPERVTNVDKKQDGDDDDSAHATTIEFDILREIVMNLSQERSDHYDNWTRVLWAVTNVASGNGYRKKGRDLCHEFSAKSAKYTEEETEKILDKARENGGLNLGSLMMWLKDDNKTAFTSIQNKLNPIHTVLKGYSFIDDPEPINLLDGERRDYFTMKEIFEKNNFKVCNKKVLYVELVKIGNNEVIKDRTRGEAIDKFENLFYFQQEPQFDDECEPTFTKHNFLERWLKDSTIRTYEAMDFLPPPIAGNLKTFNLWKGFRAEKIDLTISREARIELLKPIYNHLDIICNRDEKSFNYTKKFIAQLIQQPSRKIGIALCFQSVEGTGKNTLFSEFIGNLVIGEEYYWESRDCVSDLFSKHSNAFFRRLLVNIDEPRAIDLRQNADKFKNLITSSKQRIEGKGKDTQQVTTCERYIITTNNEDVLKLSSNDRRFAVIECSDELINDTEYFDNIYRYIQRPEVQRAFYDDMMEENIENFNWKKERPMTDAYIKNLDSCVCPHIRFMAGEVKANEKYLEQYDISGQELFKKFNRVLTACRSKYTCEYISFNKKIGKLGGITKSKCMYGVVWHININALKKHLEEKEKFDFGHYQFYEEIDDDNCKN